MNRELLLERLLATTREGFWLIDNDAIGVEVNPAMCEILARPAEEILGRSIYDFVDTENRTVFLRQIELRKQGLVGPYEVSLIRGDGSRIPCINNATPIFDVDGTPVGSVGLWTDISDQKLAEQALRAAKDTAERASEAKSDFLSSMSHELRTPLNSIMGFSQLIEMSLPDESNPRLERYVASIQRSSEHLKTLVAEVLELSRIDAHASSPVIGKLDIRNEIELCVDMLQPLAQVNRVDVIEPTAPTAAVLADPDHLRRAILNLVSNAIKYNRPGGTVRIAVTPVSEHRTRMSVTDTGIGIRPERQGEVFQAFNRLGHEHSAIEGAGVGLLLTKRAVEAMGGRIGFESTPDAGSTFWIELEVAGPEGLGRPAIETTKAPLGLHDLPPLDGKVLYIDDHEGNRDLMRERLAHFPGLDLTLFDSAETALPKIRSLRPDVVFIDINLPGIDGIEAARRIKADPETAAVPVVSVSATHIAAERQQTSNVVFEGHLSKPVLFDELVGVLQACLPVQNRIKVNRATLNQVKPSRTGSS